MGQLQQWVRTAMAQLQAIAEHLHQQAMADEATALFDRLLMGSVGVPLPKFWPEAQGLPEGSWRQQAGELRRLRLYSKNIPSSERVPPPTLSASLALDEDGTVYGLLHSSDSGLSQAFWAQEGVSEYRYWDHTDRPDHLTEDDWMNRRRTWDRLLDPMGRLKSVMRLNLVADEEVVPDLDPDLIGPLGRPVEERVARWTNLALAHRLDQEFDAQRGKPTHQGLGAYAARLRILLEDLNHPWRQEVQPLIQAALDTPLCLADLTTRDDQHRQHLVAAAQARALALQVTQADVAPATKPRF